MAFYRTNKNRILSGYDSTVLSVNHRGYNTIAPENTLPAFTLSKQMGFDYVETDIEFTSDNVPVLLHDSTINRTSNGSGNISQMTFQQVRQYDFGSWKSPEYAGTKIPSLMEFLKLCKCLELHPYMEIKSNVSYTEAQLGLIVEYVNKYGLTGKVTYISFNSTFLSIIKNIDNKARLGYLKSTYAANDVNICNGLKTGYNEVFYDLSYDSMTDEVASEFSSSNIPVELWTIDNQNDILTMNDYVTGVTSNTQIAGLVLYNSMIG